MAPLAKINTEEQIQKLTTCYVENKMSTTDIAEKSVEIFGFSVSSASIYNTLKTNKIPIRSISESVSRAMSTLDKDVSYLTEDRLEWIDGFLLGDGGINFDRKRTKRTENFGHSRFFMGSKYQEWVDYGMSKFDVYMANNSTIGGTIDKKHPNQMWSSRTLGHSDITKQTERWYPLPSCKKIVPADVRITPTSTMLWYLGDGCLKRNKSIYLATCSFSIEDINNILIPKLKNHNINSYLNYWKNYPYICITSNSVGDFFNFIGYKSPISCYDYKFDYEKWYDLKRISDIAKNKQEVWMAQWYCKNNKIEFSRSPGEKIFLFNDEQARILREKLDKRDNQNVDSLMIKYSNKHAIQGMMSSSYTPFNNYCGYIKNKKEVVLFDQSISKNYTNYEKISLNYIEDKDTIITGYTKNNLYKLDVTISKLNDKFFKLEGKKFREIRETRNHYNKCVTIKHEIEDVQEVISLIDLWIKNRGDKYGWQCHAGYDKNFFLKYYNDEKENLWSSFFYIDNKLVGYSIVSKEDVSKLNCFVYVIRKNDTTLRNLCLYIDFKTFEYIYSEINNDIFINWGGSDGSLLKYKEKFPVYISKKVFCIKYIKNKNVEIQKEQPLNEVKKENTMSVNKINAPYDETNSSNPYLINTNKEDQILDKDGIPLSAEYIWSKRGQDREDLVEYVFHYYRNKGFPYPILSTDELNKCYKKLQKIKNKEIFEKSESADNTINGLVKNSNSTGTDIIKHFCSNEFYSATNLKSKSLLHVFNDDELFKRTLKNRMGFNCSSEDGTERPYVFGINDSMIIQGIRSSGLGSAISQFKPAVAKYIYSKFVPANGTVFDYSCGWGARLLGALSLNLRYIGIDPLTADKLNSMGKFFNGDCNIIKGCSEDSSLYNEKVDFIFSSPPYFDLEKYSNEDTQCYVRYSDYNTWLIKYWEKTVQNCLGILKDGGYFGVCVVDKYGKHEIAKDMLNVCENNGLKIKDILPMKTAKSHLSGKKESGVTMKFTDAIYILERK